MFTKLLNALVNLNINLRLRINQLNHQMTSYERLNNLFTISFKNSIFLLMNCDGLKLLFKEFNT